MNWYLQAWKNSFNYNGRARRKEYWYYTLFYFVFLVLTVFIDNLITGSSSGEGLKVFPMVFFLVSIIPTLSVSVRRLHDVGHSGWMILVSFIPVIGAVWLLVLHATDSDPGKNEYGPNPKAG